MAEDAHATAVYLDNSCAAESGGLAGGIPRDEVREMGDVPGAKSDLNTSAQLYENTAFRHRAKHRQTLATSDIHDGYARSW